MVVSRNIEALLLQQATTIRKTINYIISIIFHLVGKAFDQAGHINGDPESLFKDGSLLELKNWLTINKPVGE